MLKVLKIVVISLCAILLVACGGGGAAASPSDAAKSFMEAFASLDTEKMKPVVCSAQADSVDDMAEAFGGAGDQVKIDVSGITYQDGPISGNNATVTMSGDIKMEMMGQSVTSPVGDMFNNGVLPMVNEGGNWKVCPTDTAA